MTDIFFSYSSADRERVRPVRDALVAQGFEVFWDQEVPTGLDWDSWIRQHLAKCKCAMAFWSAASVASDNVRHEAMVAKQQGKLISVLLEPLTIQQFPMGLYAQQAANLAGWGGDTNHNEWRKFRREYEAKLIPTWVRQQLDELEAELVGERARREGVERRDKTLQAQIAKEAEAQLGLQRERDTALDEIAALKGTVQELTRARSEAEARETDTLRQVAALKVTVDDVTRARTDAEQRLTKLRQTKAKEIVQSISPFVIAAALVTLAIWTYQLVWPESQPVPAVISEAMKEAQAKLEAAEAEQQRLKDEVERQTKAATEVEAKLQTAEAEQQRQANAVAEAQTKLQDADTKRQAAEKEAADADSKRRTAEQQLAAKLEEERKATGPAILSPAASPVVTGFEKRNNMVGAGIPFQNIEGITVTECEAKCGALQKCSVLSYSILHKTCSFYDDDKLVASSRWDSAVRQSAAPPQSTPTVMASIQFEKRPNTEAIGSANNLGSYVGYSSLDECEQKCRQSISCNTYTFNKANKGCFLYPRTELRPSTSFDSGVRQSSTLSQSTPTVAASSFESRPNVVVRDSATVVERGTTVAACQDKCAQRSSCAAFTFGKVKNDCYLYDAASRFSPDVNFDSGVRQSAAPTTAQPASIGNKGPFEIRRATEATGAPLYKKDVTSIAQCEQACREDDRCQIFTYAKAAPNYCFLYDNAKASLVKNDRYDTGIRP